MKGICTYGEGNYCWHLTKLHSYVSRRESLTQLLNNLWNHVHYVTTNY